MWSQMDSDSALVETDSILSKITIKKSILPAEKVEELTKESKTSCIHSLRVKTIIMLVVFFSFVVIAFLAVILGVFPNEFVVCATGSRYKI